MTKLQKLPRDFYIRSDTLLIARQLLGKRLVVPAPDTTRVAGLIVETEAYVGATDKASHAFNNRRTKRTATMFNEGGIAYVYFIYGMYYQFNVVTNIEAEPHAVLIRAIEPQEGLTWMRARRAVKHDINLTNGPGKLCIVLGLDGSYNAADLSGDRVWIEGSDMRIETQQIASGPRIGIAYAQEFADKPWRFWVKNNPYVSRQ